MGMKESGYQRGGKLRAAKTHRSSHPNCLWTACLSSALEHFVFCFGEILLQREAGKDQSGSTSRERWNARGVELPHLSNCAPHREFILRISYTFTLSIFPALPQTPPLNLRPSPCSTPEESLLPKGSSPKEIPHDGTHRITKKHQRAPFTLHYHAKMLIQKSLVETLPSVSHGTWYTAQAQCWPDCVAQGMLHI